LSKVARKLATLDNVHRWHLTGKPEVFFSFLPLSSEVPALIRRPKSSSSVFWMAVIRLQAEESSAARPASTS
jgi:hypothetical protein